MDDEIFEIARQIERCRRLASWITDDEVRHSLELIAEDYEAQLRPPPSEPFMLRRGAGE